MQLHSREIEDVDIAVQSAAGGLRLEGYASVFCVPDRVGDIVMPGAFGEPVRFLPMLFSHAPDACVGAWSEVREDATGLFVRGFLSTACPVGRLAAAMIRTGSLRGLSIGYRVRRAEPRHKSPGRILHEVSLVEVSLVLSPTHPDARLKVAIAQMEAA